MASFSPTEAAFEGFRLTREHPRAVLAWAIAYFAFTMAVSVLALAWEGKDFAALQALGQSTNPDPEEVLRVFQRLTPYILIVLPLQAVFFAVLNCAIYRAVLRPQQRGMGYFHLGPDEFRMMALAIIMFLLWLLAIFLVVFVVSLIAGTIGVFGGSLGAVIGALVDIAAVSAVIWVYVRLSMAAPMTFDQRRMVVFGSWSFTRGSFWRLFGAYVLTALLGAVIVVLMLVISSAFIAASLMATGGSMAAVGHDVQTGISTVGALLTLPTLLSQAFGSAMVIVCFVIAISPKAIAYQGLAGYGDKDAETFA